MRSIALSICCLFLVCGMVWAQATGQINGTVRDETGAVIPGAMIKATQTATGVVRTAVSAEDGRYVLASLPLGPYMVEVTQPGFTNYVQTGIVLQVDSNVTIDARLKVGAVGEEVTVEANLAQVETRSTNIGAVVDNLRIAEMPLNGRNPIELVFLAGMASSPGNGNINTVRNYPTIVVSVAGGQGNSVSYQLDGTVYQDPYNNLALPLPFPDALQEFKVETSVLQPQYGYHSGATVNAVTKSGTNQFHGDLFEFLRNGMFNARDFFATKRDTLKRNQFGGVLGGPVFKDKLFFFGGYQGTIQRSDPAFNTGYVPTSAMLQGDFTAFASAACQGTAKTLSAAQGFVNNRISPDRLNSVAVNMSKTFPTPLDACGTVKYGYVTNQHEDIYVARIDWQKSQKNSIFGRYVGGILNVASTYDGKNPLTINTFGVHDYDYQVALGNTYLINANIVNSFRLSASRTNVQKLNDNYASLADFGADFAPLGGRVPSMTVTGGLGFAIGGGAASPGISHNGPNPSISDDISWVRGTHQYGLGGNLYHQRMNYWSGVNAVGPITFNGTVTGLGLADFLTGNANTFGQGTIYGFYERQYYASLYAQDSWKANRRLTINYGVRWEPYLAITNKQGQIHYFDKDLYAQNYHSPVFSNAPSGMIFPGDPKYVCGKGYGCNEWAKFFPRVGIAFDPGGDGKMAIRASYGMSGDRSHMFFPNQMSFGPPFADRVSLSNVNLSNLWGTFPGVPGFSPAGKNPMAALAQVAAIGNTAKDAPFPTAGFYVNNVEDLHHSKPMYVNMWNLSVQRQVGTWLLTANYVGNSTIHMNSSTTANPAVFLGLGPCTLNVVQANGTVAPQNYSTCSTTANENFRRVLYLQDPLKGQFYANIAQELNGGTASYEGLYLSANKALTHGVSMSTNYTWSHCISDVYDQQPSGNGLVRPDNRRAYRGNCTVGVADARHFFALNMVANMPKFANKALGIVASNWQLAPILQLKSGNFMSITSGTDRALTTAFSATGGQGQTGNQLLADVYAPSKAATCAPCITYLNKDAFSIPALGTYGNMAYGTVQGPGLIQLNLALSRTFPIRENRTLQLRAEAFNLPNHLNPLIPAANQNLNSALFGIANQDQSGIAGQVSGTTSGDYRVIQFALKLVF